MSIHQRSLAQAHKRATCEALQGYACQEQEITRGQAHQDQAKTGGNGAACYEETARPYIADDAENGITYDIAAF